MKNLISLSLLLFIAFSAGAQGITFESGSWKEVISKAKKEKKPIYLDVYTTWCGPCKMMAAKIFPEKEAGEKYNALFINYKIDAEKGEGIEIAKKYKVNGYPTNLYINPENEEVIYRAMGAVMQVSEFNKRADIAIAEAKDPLKWEEYQAKMEKGETDKTFLEAYIEKASRLDKNNDPALDIYVQKYVTANPDEKTLNYLLANTKTLDNSAITVLEANKEQIKKIYAGKEEHLTGWGQAMVYGTLEKAISLKDEKLLDKIAAGLQKYDSENAESDIFWYRKEFYKKTENEAKEWQVSMEEANYFMKINDKELKNKDEKGGEQVKTSIRQQIQAMGYPDSNQDSLLNLTLTQNPSYLKPASVKAAQSLNAAAWKVYEEKSTDKALVQQALKWSEKSLKLANGLNNLWPSLADTYAHLLYISGDKKKAIAMQEEAIKKANPEDAEGLKEALEKMKTGKL